MNKLLICAVWLIRILITVAPGTAVGQQERELFHITLRKGRISAMAWSSDGKKLAVGYFDCDNCPVQILELVRDKSDIVAARLTAELEAYTITSLLWSPDNSELVTISGEFFFERPIPHLIQKWDVGTGKLLDVLYQLPDPEQRFKPSVAVSKDLTHIAIENGDHTISLSNGLNIVPKGREIIGVGLLAWSPNNQYLATGSYENEDLNTAVEIWNTITGERISVYHYAYEPNSPIVQFLWSPDSQYLLLVNNFDYYDRRYIYAPIQHNALRLLDTTTGNMIWGPYDIGSYTSDVIWSPNGYLFTWSYTLINEAVVFRDAATGRLEYAVFPQGEFLPWPGVQMQQCWRKRGKMDLFVFGMYRILYRSCEKAER